MPHSDANDDDNIHEDVTAPYQPFPQPPTAPRQDFYRDWANPHQYVRPGAERRPGENYGPSMFPTQENVGQNPAQSGRPTYPTSGDPSLGSGGMQSRQLPMWGTLPPDASGNRSPSGSRSWRSGAILALALVLLLVFGVGLFSGWVFARNGANSPGVFSPLQTNSNSKVTVPTVDNNSSNLDIVREAVVSKVE